MTREAVDKRTPRGDAPRRRKGQELSFGEITGLVHAALKEQLKPTEECVGPWVREIWNEKVVYEYEGKTFECTYTLSTEPLQVALGEPAPVKVAFVPTGDSVRRVRIDFLAPIHCDPQRKDGVFADLDPTTGFMTLDGRMTRTGVFRYRDKDGNEWGELRTEDEVFSPESMASFQRVVVTNDHPDSFVSVKNVKSVQAGHVGSAVRRENDYLRADITITDPATILEIQQGKRELSCGYTAELIEDEGEFNGERYSVRQTNIRGNHLAIVDVGRAGPSCALISRGDGAAFTDLSSRQAINHGGAMPAPKKTADAADKSIEQITKDALAALQAKQAKKADEGTAEKLAGLIALLTKALKSGDEMLQEAAWAKAAELLAAPATAPSEPEAPASEEPTAETPDEPGEVKDEPAPEEPKEEPMAQDSADVAKLSAKIVALEEQRKKDAAAQAREAQAIRALGRLERQALEIVPGLKIDDGLSTQAATNAIMRAVVLEVMPGHKDRLDAQVKAHGAGYLQALFDEAVKLHGDRERHADSLGEALLGARKTDASDGPGAAFRDYMRRLDARSRKNTPIERKAS